MFHALKGHDNSSPVRMNLAGQAGQPAGWQEFGSAFHLAYAREVPASLNMVHDVWKKGIGKGVN